jgi:TorA maturation chaperone TorD
MAPDHLGIELAFMQTLIYRNEMQPQSKFLEDHIIPWVVPYMMGMRSMADTPFYRDICDFAVEFLSADFEYLSQSVTHG